MLSKKFIMWVGVGLLAAALPAVGATVKHHSFTVKPTPKHVALAATVKHTVKPVTHTTKVKRHTTSHGAKHATLVKPAASSGGHGVTSMHSGHRTLAHHS
jgi:hypothetical protein